MNVTMIRLVGLFTIDLPMSVARPQDPYIIRDATGLGPSDHTVSIAPASTIGGFFQGRKPVNKILELTVGLTPDYRLNQTSEMLRTQLYGLLAPESDDGSILVQFLQGDTILATTVGWMSKMEPVLFSKDPAVSFTIETAWPYFEAVDVVEYVPTDVSGFSIENPGTAPTSMQFNLKLNAPSTFFYIRIGTKFIRFDYSFLSGDVINIDTKPMSRLATVTRAGKVRTLLGAFSPNSVWLELHGGTNRFVVSPQVLTWGYIRYRPQYLGV